MATAKAADGEVSKAGPVLLSFYADVRIHSATPVLRPGQKGKVANIPDHDPPAGYTCHRCSQKGRQHFET